MSALDPHTVTAAKTADAAAPLMSARRTSMIGAALVAIGPISMALYTPAMPALVEAFGTTSAAIKLTLTTYFFGFAIAQLICGPLIDAFGRKRISLLFLTLYLASSALATFAPDVSLMIFARALQGIGAAVGIAVSRAIVRDQFTGQASAQIMNTVAMMLALGPAVSPTIGGIVLELAGWRAVFWCMIVYGAALMLVVVLFQRETNPNPGTHHLNPRRLAANYLMLMSDPRFLRPALLVGFGLGTLYAFASVLPFVLIYDVGLSPSEFGLAMVLQSGSFIAGTIVTARLLRHFEAGRLVPYSLVLFAVSSVAMCAITLTQDLSVVSVMGPVMIFAVALALCLPACMTDSMAPFPHIAGAVSSLTGFLQFGGGILGSLLVALAGDPILGLTYGLPAMPLIGIAVYVGLGRVKQEEKALVE